MYKKWKSEKNVSNSAPRVAAYATTAFYVLIVLEFFYMASPFAVYFYSAYGPGLHWLGDSDVTAWTTRFVLPHIVSQTNSVLINSHTIIGLTLFTIGIVGFGFGAYRVYRNKLGSGQIVQTGFYKRIRHPQYACLMLASLGTLLIWPRMLAVVGFVLVVIFYIVLAKAEEVRCDSLDPSYPEYRDRTGFLLPRSVEWPFRMLRAQLKELPPFLYWTSITAFSLVFMISSSYSIKNWSTTQINGVYSPSMATISIGQEPLDKIDNVLQLALNSTETSERLEVFTTNNQPLINYVLPVDMHVSEVPMYLPQGSTTTHHYVNDLARSRFKIIFTEAVLPRGASANGIQILRQATNKHPIVEVWVDLRKQIVEKTLEPPIKAFYNGIPVPVF